MARVTHQIQVSPTQYYNATDMESYTSAYGQLNGPLSIPYMPSDRSQNAMPFLGTEPGFFPPNHSQGGQNNGIQAANGWWAPSFHGEDGSSASAANLTGYQHFQHDSIQPYMDPVGRPVHLPGPSFTGPEMFGTAFIDHLQQLNTESASQTDRNFNQGSRNAGSNL
jgi:hypothetical protein